MKTNTKEEQKGFVLVVVALVLVVLVGFVALGVDTGALYSARTEAQQVADAAALAGAFTYINSPAAPQPSTATNYATQVAVNNSIMGQPVTTSDVTVTFPDGPYPTGRKIAVEVRSTQKTYFARALWNSTADIRVTATAEAAEHSTGACCTRPWFLSNTIFASTDICTAKCDTSQLLIDPTTREVTAFAGTKIGTEFTIKPQSSSAALSPGEFYLIDLPDASGNTTGGAGYEASIVNGAPAASACLSTYSVLTGNKVGPTKSGVETLVGKPPRYTYVAPGQYQRVSDGKIFDISENVIIAPIWDVCGMAGFCPDAKLSGTTPSLQMIGWGVLFLEGTSGNDVLARLVNVSSCGTDSSSESGSSVLTLPLRLVRS